jgi:hypothetical protein
MRDYWPTDPATSTPTFANLMSGGRYKHIWQYWHFSDTTKAEDNSHRLYKIKPNFNYFLTKLKTAYKPKQNLSHNKGVILC